MRKFPTLAVFASPASGMLSPVCGFLVVAFPLLRIAEQRTAKLHRRDFAARFDALHELHGFDDGDGAPGEESSDVGARRKRRSTPGHAARRKRRWAAVGERRLASANHNCLQLGCGAVSYIGQCADDGATLTWCEAGQLRTASCRDSKVCAWQNDTIGYNCVQP